MSGKNPMDEGYGKPKFDPENQGKSPYEIDSTDMNYIGEGTPQPTEDDPNADLAAMYATKPKGKSSFTISDGKPAKEKKGLSSGALVLIIFLLLVGGAAAVLFLTQRSVFAEDGTTQNVSTYEWLMGLSSQSEFQRNMAEMPEELRPDYISLHRLERVFEAAGAFEAANAQAPTNVQSLVDGGFIEPNWIIDGWGARFQIISAVPLEIGTPGEDGRLNTGTDIVVSDRGVRMSRRLDVYFAEKY